MARWCSSCAREAAIRSQCSPPSAASSQSWTRHCRCTRSRRWRDVGLRTVGNRWFATSLFAAFGLLALALAALGVFGVLAFVVEQRTREVGIRIALGATHGSVVGRIIGQGMRIAEVGLIIGVIVASAASRLLSNLLWEVRPTDPATLGLVAAVAFATALLAAYLPARRAARIDPAQLVRESGV